MWPFIRLNPIGIIIVCLLFFSLYLIYTSNSERDNFIRNYEEQNLINYKKKHLDDGDELIPAFSHKRHSFIKDEYIKQEIMLFQMVDLVELLNVAIQVAENGGREVRKTRELANLKQGDKGNGNDPLTEGDMRSHQVMVGQLSASFPGLNIISEETGSKLKDVENVRFNLINKARLLDQLKSLPTISVALTDLTIWIDPLDATQEYTENLVKYVTTMICVAYKGEPLIGIIHKPFKNTKLSTNHTNVDYETYWAWDKIAMSSNLETVLSKRKKSANMDNLSIIVSRSHKGTVQSLSENLFGKNSKIISAGGSGYKTIELIKGNTDVYLHNSLIKKWDICAPNALINAISRRTNANFTTLKGENVKYKDDSVKNFDGVLATIGLDNSTHLKIIENLQNII